MDIAVLGMGRMGQAVAHRLLEGGHSVRVWNRTAGRAGPVVGAGATEAGSIAEAVRGTDVVITSLANDDAVREVALGRGGVAGSIEGPTIYLDASTVSPGMAGDLAEAIPRYAAMPILGAPVAVASGKAIFLLGGSDDVLEVALPLARSLSDSVRRYPEPQLAGAAKLAVNTLLLDVVVALSEAFAVGRAGGLTEDQLADLLSASPIVPPGIANRFEGILRGGQEGWWSPALGAKDAGLAVDLAASDGHQLPVTASARDQYQRTAEAEVGAPGDIADVTSRYRSD
ncbi:MAG: 6-phosphogluconate dehydrogenase binding protein [Acidimicrobiales bacterium]|nr:6-phosphogluconate dehydrogenase binding protein [Acidimicrobiales bacterium]